MSLKRTALYDEHVRLGGRMVDFGGWELPVQYTGVLDEHEACRSACGLFDVSHMGEFHVEGPDAARYLDFLVTNHVEALPIGKALYTAMCNVRGGIVDDLVIYRRAKDRFLVVVNASNTDKDFAHAQTIEQQFRAQGAATFTLTNESAKYSQIAVQGRRAVDIVKQLTDTRLEPIATYGFAEGRLCGGAIPAIIARTGYTGEDGFELYVPWSEGPRVWHALLEAGTPLGLKPCGLGARDTLRLEMKYPLYGNELSDETSPLEAGLGWVVKLDKPGDFVGKEPIRQLKTAGLRRKLVGLVMRGRGIPRHGYPVCDAASGAVIGEVTSGTQSPSLKLPLAVAYVATAQAAVGTAIAVDIRGVKIPAEVVPTPFYKRPY